MMNPQTLELETTAFNYEDATISDMLRFATRIRDRRLQYCRDRARLFESQRAALGTLSGPPQPPSAPSRPCPPNNGDIPPPPAPPRPCPEIRLPTLHPSSLIPPPPPCSGGGPNLHSFCNPCADADGRGNSTPINSCNGTTESQPPDTSSGSSRIRSQTPSSQPTGESRTATCGTGSYRTPTIPTVTGGPQHNCTMISCPICKGDLRVSLFPLCGGGDSTRGVSGSSNITSSTFGRVSTVGTSSLGHPITNSSGGNSTTETELARIRVEFSQHEHDSL